MSASTRQGALFGGRRRELQEFAQSGCPGVVHGRAHSHLDSLQIQVPRLTATAKDDAQKLVYFARDPPPGVGRSRRSGVDPREGHELVWCGGQVRGRKSEFSPTRVAVLDEPAQHERSPEDFVGALDVAREQCRTYDTRTPTWRAEGRCFVDREAVTLALCT